METGTPFEKASSSGNNENKISSKYSLHDTPLYAGQLWSKIIFKSDLDNINEETAKLVYFAVPEVKEMPLWHKLWHFTQINDEDYFVDLTTELKNNFLSLKEEHPTVYMHNLALMIYFTKNELIDSSIDEITSSVSQYLAEHDESDIWKIQKKYPSYYFNETGIAYFNDIDEDFKEQQRKIQNKISIESKKEEANKKKLEFDAIYTSITDGNIAYLNDFFLDKHHYNSVLELIDPPKFAQALLAAPNATINHINAIVHDRYFSNSYYNGINLHVYFKNEVDFWEEVILILKNQLKGHKAIKKHNLQKLISPLIKDVINRLRE